MAYVFTLCYLFCNTFDLPNLANYSPYELVFGRKPKPLIDVETNPDIKVVETFKEYYTLLGKRFQYLHEVLQDARTKRLALMNKDRDQFQYNSGDLVCIISPLTSQLRTAPGKSQLNTSVHLQFKKLLTHTIIC